MQVNGKSIKLKQITSILMYYKTNLKFIFQLRIYLGFECAIFLEKNTSF